MNEMEGKDTRIVKNAREYGEPSSDNPLKWKPQTIGKIKPPPSNPPLDPEDHNNNNNSNINNSNDTNNKDNNNNNVVNEEGGCTNPQGEDVGVEDLLQTSKIEDIDELPHDDGPAPNQVAEKWGEDDEEFSLPTSLSSQDDGGHHSTSTGIPDDEGDAQRDIDLLDTEMSENGDRGFEEGNEKFSVPKSLSSQDDGGHRSSSADIPDDVGGVKQAIVDRRYEEGNNMFSLPKSLPSQDIGEIPPCPSMASVEGSEEQIMAWKKTNVSENREISMPKSLSSQTDGILPHPFLPNVGINNVILNVGFNNKKAIKKAKKKARANASRMFKRASSKKRGRMNAEKRMESLKNALTELKRDVILMKEKMNGLDNANNGKGSIIPLQIMYMMDDMRKIGREFTRVYLPKIIGYIMFGSAMAALGYMKGVKGLED